ncbi:Spo0E family sporulation regulatory protein-aspartic acid phosphatase [Virgibacillus profundi]|uniref:Spo0E family sporulation regulatory protein-aspartic acid phosphatase n=1 Tax=Virgibacillus profundi TaxID=2024555 RepID=A0A2A2ICB0_9BACI|nr:aspartyl-phosphate phosphatase Spo0E family protein [Virgibacillus profundi]PAV28785.1 Spo0E family sporulation regulatory protein-aspartic acid phosphatase [Virgibacillus profundi]PXY52953.1 aspartyl-phosphate phosphatase Spo0E family protein [Virgibacillus profundi]
MVETEKLLKQIEFLRTEMTKVALEKGFTNVESISISQELDHLLNLYESKEQSDVKK